MRDDNPAAMRDEIERLHPGIELAELTADELRTALISARGAARRGQRITRIALEPFEEPHLGWVERMLRFEHAGTDHA